MKWRILLIIYTVILFTIFLLAYLDLMPTKVRSIPYYDSFCHFVLYGSWGYLFARASPKPILAIKGIVVPLGICIVFPFAIIEELMQNFSPIRTFSLFDLGWGLLGIIIACLLVNFYSKKQTSYRIDR